MSGDFGGLRGIVEEARELAREQVSHPLIDCPICGTPLDQRDGISNCPMGHFRTIASTQSEIGGM